MCLILVEITSHTDELTWKKTPFSRTDRQRESLESLKTLLTIAPIFQQINENKTFSIRTDASPYTVGAVLLHGEEDDEHPVEYASKLLKKVE